MNRSAHALVLLVAGLLSAACSPARTGVVNGMLATNQRPAISITASAPFSLMDSGRVWVSPDTEELPGSLDVSFDYAVYADAAVSPASRLAYAAIIRLDDKERWNFVPQGKTLPGSFGPRKKMDSPGLEGAVYTLCVPAAGDWASAFLAANGTAAPKAWIAKRWLVSLDKDVRAMAEYREPWPEDLAVPESDIVLLRDSHAAFLSEFEKRAVAVFSFEALPGDFSAAPPASGRQPSPVLPDVKKLVGDIIFIENYSNTFD